MLGLFVFPLATFLVGQNSELSDYKKVFYANNYNMAHYVELKWDVPYYITLAVMSIETNYGRNRKRYERGDHFGTGKSYPIANAFDEWGLKMKTTHYTIEGDKAYLIKVSKRIAEQNIRGYDKP